MNKKEPYRGSDFRLRCHHDIPLCEQCAWCDMEELRREMHEIDFWSNVTMGLFAIIVGAGIGVAIAASFGVF